MSTRIGHKTFDYKQTDIHSPIVPLEIFNSSITSLITDKDDTNFERAISANVLSISPVGAEIDWSQLNATHKLGDTINVKIKANGISSTFFGLLIADEKTLPGKRIVGVRWCETPTTNVNDVEKRANNRWLCSEAFLPNGIAPNPARFNDFIYFKVLDLSKDGMQITTSMRNKLIIPEMVLDSVLSLPLIGEANISFKIQNVRIREDNNKEILVLGVQFLKPSDQFFEKIGQYLLQFGKNISPLELKKAGISPKSVNSAVEFSFVKDAQTYKDILKLRRATYTKTKLTENTDEDLLWADLYDSKSRIIVAKHSNKCVGTVRLTFHEPGESTEYHTYTKFPENFPNSADLVVSGRLCTDPNYRGKDLFDGLIRQMVLTGLQSKRKFLLGCSEASIVHLYERIGLKKTGINFTREHPQVVKLEVLCMDISATVVGRGIQFKWWRRIYKGLDQYISDFKDFEISPLDRIRLKIFKIVDNILISFRM